jgi:hypothetical protein
MKDPNCRTCGHYSKNINTNSPSMYLQKWIKYNDTWYRVVSIKTNSFGVQELGLYIGDEDNHLWISLQDVKEWSPNNPTV